MIRQFPIVLGGGSSSLSPYISLSPEEFSLDLTDIGADKGSGFNGLVTTLDFNPDVNGTVWSKFNFKNSGFNHDNPIYFDIHWIANGSIGSDLATRITLKVWTVSADDLPLANVPIDSVTSDITITTTTTGTKQLSEDFFTLTAVNIPATCESIYVSITREATSVSDTYSGTFQITNLVCRQ